MLIIKNNDQHIFVESNVIRLSKRFMCFWTPGTWPLTIVQFCDEPKKYLKNINTPKNNPFSDPPQKKINIEIQNFEPQKMTLAYLCMKISESLPGVAISKFTARWVTVLCPWARHFFHCKKADFPL